jgi:Flp pilus assembly protein CpaB
METVVAKIKQLRIYTVVKTYFRRQGKASLWFSLIIGGIVCFETGSWLMGNTNDITDPRYLVSVRDLPTGEPLNIIDFTFRTIRRDKPQGALTDQELHLLNGAKLIRPLYKGGLLLLENVILAKGGRLSNSIPRGMRAYTIQPANTVPLRSGDKIDVLWSRGGEREMPMNLLSGATVLNCVYHGERAEVVIAVGGHDLPALEKAREYGKLTIALRNPEDVGSSEMQAASQRHPFLRAQHRRGIEIISEEAK